MVGFIVGRDGLTHNMLNDIHNHWKNEEAMRIKCQGVPTVDMRNVCTQLEVSYVLIMALNLILAGTIFSSFFSLLPDFTFISVCTILYLL